MKKIFFFFLLSLVSFSNVAHAQNIADYLAPAFPSDLVANHKGDAVAWVFNDKGSRNIYYGQLATNNFKALTQYKGDDGVEIGSIVFAPNDDKIYFVRGNTTNAKGEPANPAQLQYTTEQNIYSLDIASGTIKKLAKGSGPVISPDGKLLVYTQGAKAWKINLTEETVTVQPLFFSRGSINSLAFNASGKQILFVSNREEHSFIGVYDLASNQVSFIDASTYNDSDPVWNKEGTHIAFVRTVNVKYDIGFTPRPTAAQPWEIRLAELATHKAYTLSLIHI